MRKYGVLVLGSVGMIAGAVLLSNSPAPGAGYGWFAYAPLSSTAFVPTAPPLPWILAAVCIGLGVALIAAWIGYRLGRRHSR
ncbi:hypothetical protein BH11ACT3_BH11ACT3_19170 [soil metagenome]